MTQTWPEFGRTGLSILISVSPCGWLLAMLRLAEEQLPIRQVDCASWCTGLTLQRACSIDCPGFAERWGTCVGPGPLTSLRSLKLCNFLPHSNRCAHSETSSGRIPALKLLSPPSLWPHNPTPQLSGCSPSGRHSHNYRPSL